MLAKNIPNALQSVDPNHLVAVMRQDGGHESALDVEYIQFAKLYEFTTNLEKRFSHPFRLILITIEQSQEQTASETDTERAMYYMDQAIRQNVRDVDVLTRYNARQFLVLMLGTDPDGVTIAMDRIFKAYYKMSGSSSYSPSYSIVEK